MDMSNMDKLRGMPLGFPFAMVILGVVACLVASVFGGINEFFFLNFGARLQELGIHLLIVGAVLQGVLWVCGAFGKHGDSKPPA